MGTDSLIIMRVKHNNNYIVYCKLYQQYDGYFTGVGKILIDFLLSVKSTDSMAGPGCLFAQIVKLFKDEVGHAYIENPNGSYIAEYNYFVDVDAENHTIEIEIKKDTGFSFRGPLEKAQHLINTPSQYLINKESTGLHPCIDN